MKRKFSGFFVLSVILLCGQFIQEQMLKPADLEKKTSSTVKSCKLTGTAFVEGQTTGQNTFMLYKHMALVVYNYCYKTLAKQPTGFPGIVSGYMKDFKCCIYEKEIL
jgi:hypothetical protein